MKKGIVLLLTLLLVAALCGCAGNSTAQTSSHGATTSSAAGDDGQKLQIGVIQLAEHPSLDTIRTSVVEQLTEQLGADRLEFDLQNAQGDPSNINSIIQKFVGAQKDMIITIATSPAQAALSATSEIPIVFAAVSDPVGASLMTDMQHPQANITGTSDRLPIEEIFALMEQTAGDVQTVGLLYNSGEPNSLSAVEEAKAYCDANGIAYVESVATNAGEAQQAATSLVGKCDVVFTPTDNTIATAMPVVSQVMIDAKIPLFTGADSMVIDGGFATVGIDYTVLGQVTADMAAQILNGTPIEQVPAVEMTNFAKVINSTTAQALGIDISALQADDSVKIVE